MEFKTIDWKGDKVRIIDQRELPLKEIYLDLKTPEDVYYAIKSMAIRGAPAIGILAAYGVALSSMKGDKEKTIKDIKMLRSSRPTAYNLFYALERMEKVVKENFDKEKIIEEAIKIHEEDRRICDELGKLGAELLPDEAKCFTICNAGALATGGIGTALAVFYKAKELGKRIKVFAPETRPFLQGARLTAWELNKNGIDVTLIADNAMGFIFENEKIDAVFVGADRITMNGDFANKIGTLNLAIISNYFKVPFYTVAPTTTIDRNMKDGKSIPIEERDEKEITEIKGIRIAPYNINVRNPVFDVTPNELLTGIICEKGIIKKPFNENIKKICF